MLFVSLRFRIRFKIPLFELMSGATVHFAEGMTKTAGIAESVTVRNLIQGINSPFHIICRIGKADTKSKLPVTDPHCIVEQIGKAADT